MQVIRALDRYPRDPAPSVVAQGTFDGIHLGHQAVIRLAVERARALAVTAVVVTFDPHPVAVLRPREAPPPLLPLEERLELIAGLGPEATLVLPFTPELARVEARDFVQEVLLERLRAREIVVGFNHTFGQGARGTPALLAEVTAGAGVRVHVVPLLRAGGVAVSSSSVRAALRQGDVATARTLLGRPYALRGVVARGAARGRGLGFPTANLPAPPGLLLADGVYAAWAAWEGHRAPAVVNVGVRPTFDGADRVVEAHLLGVTAELYGHPLQLAFVARIRDERRFASPEALRRRIEEDIREARRLADHA
jgi:riboflavin kinase/FMN adenylyltransferase